MNTTIKEIYVSVLKDRFKLELHQADNGMLEVEVIMDYEELSCRYRLPQQADGELAYELES